MAALVAIVGRPNVGKSTFFNRLIGERKAIIDNISGVTRDRIYGNTEWNGKEFTVIDTGGFVSNSDDIFEAAIREQVLIAMDEADVIVLMTDVTTGITDLDEYMANMLRKSSKPVFVLVNKVDNSSRNFIANEFWSLGFENTFFVSSITGSGTGEILDAISEILPENEEEDDSEIPKFAIIGQPNVGKSSLTNALLGAERNIVTDIAGTTRDSVHSLYNLYGKQFYIIDTAGIRKKAKVHENLEFYSVMRAIRAIEEADVCILMLDATLGIESQDLSIFKLVIQRNKGIVILVNKWDLVDKETNTARDYEKELRYKLAPFNDLPILFVSATEKIRISKAIDAAIVVHQKRSQRIKTSALNEVMLEAMEHYPPPTHRGKYIRIKYVSQIPVAYPSFAFFCNYPQHVKNSYKNFLENKLRENWDFTGVPIRIYFRKK